MSKRRKEFAPPRPLTRKQRTRAEREARMNRWIIAGTVAVGVLVIGILLFGYLATDVFPRRKPVATVNGVPITTADFQARVRHYRIVLQQQKDYLSAQRMELDPTDPSNAFLLEYLDNQIRQIDAMLSDTYTMMVGQEVLDQMVQEEIIRQEAIRRGLSVSSEEIDRAIEEQFGYNRDAAMAALLTPTIVAPVSGTAETVVTATATPIPTPIPKEEFDRRYQEYVKTYLKPSGLSEAQFRAMVEATLLYDKLYQAMAAELPSAMEQVQIRYFSFPTHEEAEQVVERLGQGEKWEAIAAEIEADDQGEGMASEPEWATRGFLVQQFGDEAARTIWETPAPRYTAPLTGTVGNRWYVVQVMGREVRELEPWLRSYEEQQAFQEWLQAQMATVQYTEDWASKIPAK
ncbi:MAG: SurA N-terminal domain-containing protein [Anaerolineae bacterium]|nr:SurA N-terminal domain-containing protein [Anaerolineae bacterium]MDW8069064.1 SurA N-terminal domain-containing protein [Anaerolineae bacterium]